MSHEATETVLPEEVSEQTDEPVTAEISEQSESQASPELIAQLPGIVEAAILAAGEPLSVAKLAELFEEDERPSNAEIREAIEILQAACETRGIELTQVASGFRFQVKQDNMPWLRRLWEKRPPRYSRALFETLALIAYRQPITRGEIEDVRGVAVSTHIIKTLQDREWVKIVGHRDVPGKPALFGTTKAFLDYFNLKSLKELPPLQELIDLDELEKRANQQLELPMEAQQVEAELQNEAESELMDELEFNASDESSASESGAKESGVDKITTEN